MFSETTNKQCKQWKMESNIDILAVLQRTGRAQRTLHTNSHRNIHVCVLVLLAISDLIVARATRAKHNKMCCSAIMLLFVTRTQENKG